ncbi:type II toxin-antitoxin system RelE/ParE family toxin [Syntrophus buswellii]|uniref:type II toxin-antitoxin system RelE/ParE family toxin n=1 Tax=Syntrophus TaxID=43773 RepID=UPI00345EE73D
MRIFKTKWFTRFARKEDLSDKKLADAVQELENGLHDGDLGENLTKKRLARAGEGKRGGYRTIVVYRAKNRAVFVYGFPKSTKANLSAVELDVYQKMA